MKQCHLCQMLYAPITQKKLTTPFPLCELCSAHCIINSPIHSKNPHQISTTLSGMPYSKLSKALVHNFKYRRHLKHGRLLALLLLAQMRQYYQHRQYPDSIIPIPAHPERILERSFSHTTTLACWLSRGLQIPVVHALNKVKNTPQQAGLSRQKRLNNMKKSFCPSQTQQLPQHYPVHCVLIDDVITTGATTQEARKILLQRYPKMTLDTWCIIAVPQNAI